MTRHTCFLLTWLFSALSCDTRDGSESQHLPEPVHASWSHYMGDPGRTHFSSLTQIDTTNVATLEVAWTYASGGLKDGVNTEIQHNPLIVDSALYGTNAGLLPFKIDARTGAGLWRIDSLDTGNMPVWFGKSRGLMRWVSSDGADERIYFGAGPYLYAVAARTGQLVDTFGDAGRIDLRAGLDRDPERITFGMNTPGAVFENLLIVGGRVSEGIGAAPGYIRAFDARTGERVWTFRTVPHPGEVGHETWPAEAYTYTGGANNWAGMALDVERAIVFVPTGSAAFDYYGGDRVGDNLFANTLLALDARTGTRIWHYQFVRHDVWDRDLPAPPNLVTLVRNNERIPAVAQITKSAHIFVFHRETGEPLFPIEEVAVPQSRMLGEVTAETQPLPTLPRPFGGQQLTEDLLYAPNQPARLANLVSGTTAPQPMTVLQRFRTFTSSGQFVPPDTAGVIVYPGLDGGGEWGGAAVDPRTGIMYVNGSEMAWVVALRRVGRETTRGEHGVPYGLSILARFLDGRGKPVVRPPWGTLNAIDLNTGETLWRVPLGNDEEIDDPEHPVTGTENYGGPVVTAGGLVFIAATNDEKIRAFHARTGEQLWETRLPAGGYATPATYQVDGRQYVVVAAGGGKMGTPSGDRYVAFALPGAP